MFMTKHHYFLSWLSNDNKLPVFPISGLYTNLSSTVYYYVLLSWTVTGNKAYCAIPENILSFLPVEI